MDEPDVGVALCVASLVLSLAEDNPEQYKNSYNKAANRLKKMVSKQDVPADYMYYNVPCPWLQIKLIRLMKCFPPSSKLFQQHPQFFSNQGR